jgi:hypothetical protein
LEIIRLATLNSSCHSGESGRCNPIKVDPTKSFSDPAKSFGREKQPFSLVPKPVWPDLFVKK